MLLLNLRIFLSYCHSHLVPTPVLLCTFSSPTPAPSFVSIACSFAFFFSSSCKAVFVEEVQFYQLLLHSISASPHLCWCLCVCAVLCRWKCLSIVKSDIIANVSFIRLRSANYTHYSTITGSTVNFSHPSGSLLWIPSSTCFYYYRMSHIAIFTCIAALYFGALWVNQLRMRCHGGGGTREKEAPVKFRPGCFYWGCEMKRSIKYSVRNETWAYLTNYLCFLGKLLITHKAKLPRAALHLCRWNFSKAHNMTKAGVWLPFSVQPLKQSPKTLRCEWNIRAQVISASSPTHYQHLKSSEGCSLVLHYSVYHTPERLTNIWVKISNTWLTSVRTDRPAVSRGNERLAAAPHIYM